MNEPSEAAPKPSNGLGVVTGILGLLCGVGTLVNPIKRTIWAYTELESGSLPSATPLVTALAFLLGGILLLGRVRAGIAPLQLGCGIAVLKGASVIEALTLG